MSRKIWKDYITKPNIVNGFSVKGESKVYKFQSSPIPLSENSIFLIAKGFKDQVDQKYKKIYEEIDLNRNGYILLDDIINIVILLGLISQNDTDQSYLCIKNKALEIFQVFFLISMKSKISKRDFFAVCSVNEQTRPNDSITDFFTLENFQKMKTQIIELRQVFTCYSKDNLIDPKELKSILACINAEDIYQLEALLCSETINFSRFLRFLPFFLWMHQEVVKQLDIN